MTEVESAMLLSDLSAVAAKLNTESDSINEILDAWEAKLSALNIGIEAWVTVSSEERSVEVEDEDEDNRGDNKDVPGSVDHQLGWVDGQLMTRWITYRGDLKDDYGRQEWQEISRDRVRAIRSASREIRIEALEVLPRLLGQLKEEVEAAIAKIERAKKISGWASNARTGGDR